MSQREGSTHNSSTKSRKKNNKADSNSFRLAQYRAAILFERRVLMAMTGLCCLAALIWLIALFTDYWVLVRVAGATPTPFESHSGLWRACIQNVSTSTNRSDSPTSDCTFHNLDPELQEAQSDPSVASTIIDYRRTVMALAVLSLLVMSMALGFSYYTFLNPRYTFKRLAGAIHFLTAATMVVLIEVVSGGAEYAKGHVPSLHPRGSTWQHGYSYYLAWIVFAQFVLSGCAFLVYSRKRKTRGIYNEDGTPIVDDDPQFMGRN